MRIVITSNYKEANETGAAQVTNILANELSKNHQILYLVLGEKTGIEKRNRNLEVLRVPYVNIDRIDVPLITPSAIFEIFRKLSKFKPDIVHLQNSVLVSKIVQLWARNNFTPAVVTFHHIPTQPIIHLFPQLSKNILTKVAQEMYSQTSLKLFLKKIDCVVAQNKFIYSSIRQIDRKVKIAIIPNGLDLKEYNKLRTNLPKKTVNFINLGSYIERKNQKYLINVFRYLPENYHLHCYGNVHTGKSYYLKLKGLKKEYNLKNIHLEDYVENNHLKSVLSRSHFYLSASLKEVQSLAVIIALASGKPVVGLANETISELINIKNGKILPKNTSVKKFANSIEEIVSNNNYIHVSKEAKKSSQQFGIKTVISKLEKVYQSVCNTKSKYG